MFDDFNGSAILLLWGDNADMAVLLDQVRSLDKDRHTVQVGHGENTITIMVSAEAGRSHVRSDAVISWECCKDTLRRTADLIGPLLNSTGHQFVDADGQAEEVVISANEYPADFER
ncbi:hypothetical protein BrevBR_08505 [Brevundimonas sp. BR2-1]|uniref:hypothetical protein n=1 Tax=Brevundimonas sp. BR2-1 TaxID=3031123 RepID=UPI0030A29E5A